METAMQELIEWLTEYIGTEDNPIVEMKLRGYRLKAQLLLEKEKEQIEDAYNQGTLDGESSMLEYPNYYNETYI